MLVFIAWVSGRYTAPPQTRSMSESLLPCEGVDWIVIFCGVGSGLVVGIIFGNFLYARYNDWFIERFGIRKDKWVRALSNRRRNQALYSYQTKGNKQKVTLSWQYLLFLISVNNNYSLDD
ncbi:hypothetical protein OSB04_006110 [Centaurea solstitialis]|uniref:Uncharacterized protein n=1 Tax=Centaurea solstitialis TaxID=347529 RepID=A0AA38TTZ9_9ASTR|nr:hypothetical protein OSB04_006110 [Centaurea solstitialis]